MRQPVRASNLGVPLYLTIQQGLSSPSCPCRRSDARGTKSWRVYQLLSRKCLYRSHPASASSPVTASSFVLLCPSASTTMTSKLIAEKLIARSTCSSPPSTSRQRKEVEMCQPIRFQEQVERNTRDTACKCDSCFASYDGCHLLMKVGGINSTIPPVAPPSR